MATVNPEKRNEIMAAPEDLQGEERNEDMAAPEDHQGEERNEDMAAPEDHQGEERNEIMAAPEDNQGEEKNEDMAAPKNHQGAEINDVMAVVAVGQSRSGKSTALNNLFGTDFDSEYSVASVTQKVETRRVVKGGKNIIVVDTPGMGSFDIALPRVKKILEKAIGGLEFLLLYCYSVSPSSPKTELDTKVMKNLEKTLGKDIWKKCVLLLTGCDMLRKSACQKNTDTEKYKNYLNKHAEKLSEMLKKSCGPKTPNIKTVFELEIDELPNQPIEEIIAVPVGLKWKEGSIKRERHILVPGLPGNWAQVAFKVINHKAVRLKIIGEKSVTEGKISTTGSITGIGIGAVVGAAVAGVVGAGAAGVGAIPAALIGTIGGSVVGGVLGASSGVSAQKVKNIIHHKELREKEERLKDAGIMHVDADPSEITRSTRSPAAEKPKSPSPSEPEPIWSKSPSSDSDSAVQRSPSCEKGTSDSQTSSEDSQAT